MTESTQTDQPDEKPIASIDFIDPLFAVVLHISFVEVLLVEKRQWLDDPGTLLAVGETFHFSTLLLGYATVVLSWYFYHYSISKTPGTKFWRFVCDVLLLFMYFLLLVKFESLWFVLLTLSAIFVLFYLWDQFKRTEYPEWDRPDRRGGTVIGLAGFALIFAGYLGASAVGIAEHSLSDLGKNEHPGLVEWLFLAIAFVTTLVYRWLKFEEHPVLVRLGSINLPLKSNPHQ